MKALIKKNLKASEAVTWFLMILYPAIIMAIVFLSCI